MFKTAQCGGDGPVGGGHANGVGGTGQWCQGDRPVVLWGQAGAGGQA